MIITTTPSIHGYDIEQYLGTVSANEVLGAGIGVEFFASITDLFGGKSGAYRTQLDSLYNEVYESLTIKAKQKGANAIVGLKIDFGEISGKGVSMFMVSAIGTAVKISVNRYEVFRQLHELHTYLNDNLITQDEYEREASSIKKRLTNPIEEETMRIVQATTEREAQRKREEERRARAEAISENRLAEYLEKNRADIAEMEEEKMSRVEEIKASIKDTLPRMRNEVASINVDKIESATYDDSPLKEGLLPYDFMKYLIVQGNALGAAKYYIDRYQGTTEEAVKYLLGMFQ